MYIEVKVSLKTGDGDTAPEKTFSNFNMTKIVVDGSPYEKVVLAIIDAIPEIPKE